MHNYKLKLRAYLFGILFFLPLFSAQLRAEVVSLALLKRGEVRIGILGDRHVDIVWPGMPDRHAPIDKDHKEQLLKWMERLGRLPHSTHFFYEFTPSFFETHEKTCRFAQAIGSYLGLHTALPLFAKDCKHKLGSLRFQSGDTRPDEVTTLVQLIINIDDLGETKHPILFEALSQSTSNQPTVQTFLEYLSVLEKEYPVVSDFSVASIDGQITALRTFFAPVRKDKTLQKAVFERLQSLGPLAIIEQLGVPLMTVNEISADMGLIQKTSEFLEGNSETHALLYLGHNHSLMLSRYLLSRGFTIDQEVSLRDTEALKELLSPEGELITTEASEIDRFLSRFSDINLTSSETCHYCKRESDLKKCSRCTQQSYCSRECQSADWRQHKKNCQK